MAGHEKELDGGASSVSVEEPLPSARTPLGRRLLQLRQNIIRSGVPLLNWEDLEREVAERRGERNTER